LVQGLKEIADFDISVAAYPETHPQATCAQSDIDNLKRKLDAGATRAITQMFFDPEVFFRFRDTAAAAGIDQELVPGILPVSNVAQARKFSSMCGVTIPAWMDELYEGLDDHPAARQLVAATLTAEMCRKLYAGGVRHFHFYTLNRAELSYAICHLLGKRPVAAAAKEQAA
jgi:methylenetetrahydrofolate reductase (NADPH)